MEITMQGWIKLHRKICQNELWLSEKFTRSQAWIDLLLLANHEDNYFYLRDHKINVSRGQVGYSQERLRLRWKWSRSKVKKFLKDLEKEQQLTLMESHSASIVTIINYEKYQAKEQQVVQQNNNRTTTEQQQKDTNKNVKNEKNEKKLSYSEESKQVLDFLNEKVKTKYRYSKSSLANIEARLNEGFSVKDCESVISKKMDDPYFQENKKYLNPVTLFRPSHFEVYLNEQEQSETDKLIAKYSR